MTKTASITDIIRPVIQPKYTGKSVSYLDFLSNSPDFFLRNNPKLSEVKLKEISEKQSAIQSGEWALEMALGHPSFFQFFQQFSQSNSLDTILYYDIYDHCPMAVPISQAWAMGMWASPGPCPAIFKNLSVWDSQWQGSGRRKVIECSNTKAHVSVH